ncbi:MAG: hypothetical protein V7677_19575, partial [Motiliproteus sp.]
AVQDGMISSLLAPRRNAVMTVSDRAALANGRVLAEPGKEFSRLGYVQTEMIRRLLDPRAVTATM